MTQQNLNIHQEKQQQFSVDETVRALHHISQGHNKSNIEIFPPELMDYLARERLVKALSSQMYRAASDNLEENAKKGTLPAIVNNQELSTEPQKDSYDQDNESLRLKRIMDELGTPQQRYDRFMDKWNTRAQIFVKRGEDKDSFDLDVVALTAEGREYLERNSNHPLISKKAVSY